MLFDLVQNETAFPRVKPISANEDKLLNEVYLIGKLFLLMLTKACYPLFNKGNNETKFRNVAELK